LVLIGEVKSSEMSKRRTQIPEDVAAQLLVASDHTCCKCEEKVAPIQIHHIDENPANNVRDNLAVLCLICHNETQVRGGFSRQLSPAAVRLYRDNWVARVGKRRRDADALFVERTTGRSDSRRMRDGISGEIELPKFSESQLDAYIATLPDILGVAYEQARNDWDSNTVAMIRAAYGVTEVVRQMWVRLARVFPEGHFDGLTPEQYLEDYLERRYSWHRAMAEPYGSATGGTIAGVLVARGVLRDLEAAVLDTRDALRGLSEHFQVREGWLKRWEEAKEKRLGASISQTETIASSVTQKNIPAEDTRLKALAQAPEIFDFVAFGQIVRILARQLHNTTGGPTTYALCQREHNGTETIFDTIEGHHLTLFANDIDGDGIPEAMVQYHCGAHTMMMKVYRLRAASPTPELVPGATIGSDWPDIRWDKRSDGKGFTIAIKNRNWSGKPTQEFIVETYAFDSGRFVKTGSA
jgi:hypothetical protein